MFTEEKKKNRNYGSIFVYCFVCFVLVVGLVKFAKPYKLKQNQTEMEVIVKEGFIFGVESSGIMPRRLSRSRSVSVPTQNHEKLSVPVWTYRDRAPSSYCVQFESFATMSKQVKNGKYESRPFSVGGYNWSLQIYPNGNKGDSAAAGYMSLYARIHNSSLLTNDVYAEIKFFVYSKTKDQYYTLQDNEPKRLHLFKQEWGMANAVPISTISVGNGFIFDGGKSVFGVEVFVYTPFEKWEIYSNEENIRDPLIDWKLTKFSTRYLDSYTSDPFSSGGTNWVLKVYPNGVGSAMGNSLSLYLMSASNETGYVTAKLRVLDQIRLTHLEKQVEGWPNATENGWGFDKFIPLADIRNSSKGFLLNDTLKVEVQLLSFSKTESFSI